VLSPQAGSGVPALGPSLQAGFGVLGLGAESAGRVWCAGHAIRVRSRRSRGLTCWGWRPGSDALGDLGAEPRGQNGEGFREGVMQLGVWG